MHSPSNKTWLNRYQLYLREQRYTPGSIEVEVNSCRRFLAYLHERDVSIEKVTPAILQSYLDHRLNLYQWVHGRLPQTQRPWGRSFDRGVIAFLRLVQGEWPPKTIPTTFPEKLCADYVEWLTNVRGLAPPTIKGRSLFARDFLIWLKERATPNGLHEITVTDLDKFLETRGSKLGRVAKASLAHYFRGFLRYLHMKGLTSRDLSTAVTAPTLYKHESVPSALSRDQIQTVLDATRPDRRPKGLRDFAILMLLSTYGLRGIEVVRLRLDDVDWKGERLLIRPSKNQITTMLPLMPAVGDALIDYLRNGRPKVAARQIFLCARAPYQPFKASACVHSVVVDRVRKAGIQTSGKHGTYAFRHSRAVSLLRSAVPLKAIGDILGHRVTTSTETYLKLATEDLRDVGLEIPTDKEVQL